MFEALNLLNDLSIRPKIIIETILAVSIVLQLVGAYFSVTLIKKAALWKAPWVILTGVFCLMAFRRSVSFFQHLHSENSYLGNFEAESIALIISVLLCVSMFLIRRAFGTVNDTMHFFHDRKLEIQALALTLEKEASQSKQDLANETIGPSEALLRSRISILETRQKLTEISGKLEGLV